MSEDKIRRLDADRRHGEQGALTTQQGVQVDHTDDSLSAGARGPTLLEDFHAREKITHFDHERIPERVVHARGAGAYGFFQPYDSWLSEYTAAEFLRDPELATPVFVRFSTVAGSRGSADTVRDVRGFATKFYTRQGNYDLVGNNMPVFFIQDGIKFPDFVHAVKPEPDNEIPQAQSAHDTFWDFVGLQPETLHMVMWLMSDRALPRSYRMMQGFGVHTFRLVDGHGNGTFVKFHWKPRLGVHSLLWDECQKIAGKDPDFNRRDLWDAIESGAYPEWELGVQLIAEEDEHAFDFDLLDPTKVVPEEQVPVEPVGRLVLNRNPDNFFAETEQIAFHTANIVPGIDFTNDPLLQARNFSYLDTQLIRLGGPNFAQLPVNRPVAEVHNNQRDGYGQNLVHTGKHAYFPNASGCPAIGGAFPEVFAHYQEKVSGKKVRQRSASFTDHVGQAALFWNSMSEIEQQHIVAAFCFELGKVTMPPIRERAVDRLLDIDRGLATRVAEGLGIQLADRPRREHGEVSSPALSQLNTTMDTVDTRRVAILAADGIDGLGTGKVLEALREAGVVAEILAPQEGLISAADGANLRADRAVNTMASVLYDGVVVPGGAGAVETLRADGYAVHFVLEAYKHAKPVGLCGAGRDILPDGVLDVAGLGRNGVFEEHGVVSSDATGELLEDAFLQRFLTVLKGHRVWDRPTAHIPA
ncbi:catalase [Sciscionella sediminilitoris]|uniref:catalase n=1 Tax=Sciscionella sediminilitoris TaxID=1445613 RepID=UPI0004DF4B31|nr:catalase [Sciscionella sp. SE31]